MKTPPLHIKRLNRTHMMLSLGLAILALLTCQARAQPRPTFDTCFEAASRYHDVNPLVLRAIAWQESRNNPKAINHNSNGSTDYGLMQINSIHLRELSIYNISTKTLMNPCGSIFIAAWYLRKMMNRHGNTWDAVGSYHSQTPAHRDRYASSIVSTLRAWGALQATR